MHYQSSTYIAAPLVLGAAQPPVCATTPREQQRESRIGVVSEAADAAASGECWITALAFILVLHDTHNG